MKLKEWIQAKIARPATVYNPPHIECAECGVEIARIPKNRRFCTARCKCRYNSRKMRARQAYERG